MKRTPPVVDKGCLPDIQNQEDSRDISLDRVGVTNLKYPVKILRKDGTSVDASATVTLFAGLSKLAKGHNLSRFPEALVAFGESVELLSRDTIEKLLDIMELNLGSDDVYARFEFDYFIDKKAPASGKVAPMGYACAFTGVKKHGRYDFVLEVNVIAASVCPCSREMSSLEYLNNGEIWVNENGENTPIMGSLSPKDGESDYTALVRKTMYDAANTEIGSCVGMGAHNQRSQIRVEAIFKNNSLLWIEDLAVVIEREASAPTYPILKRPDEKYVTELGYMNAKFSEDIARDLQLALEACPEIAEWSLKVRNEESIHPYDVASYQSSKNWRYH